MNAAALAVDRGREAVVRHEVGERDDGVAVRVEGLDQRALQLVERTGVGGEAAPAAAVGEHPVVEGVRGCDAAALELAGERTRPAGQAFGEVFLTVHPRFPGLAAGRQPGPTLAAATEAGRRLRSLRRYSTVDDSR